MMDDMGGIRMGSPPIAGRARRLLVHSAPDAAQKGWRESFYGD
jgi:hypothetical protein